MIGAWESLPTGIDVWHEEAKGGRRGGLIVVQEIFGVTAHIREVCAGFAAEGYEVLAPSLYDRLEKRFEGAYGREGFAKAVDYARRTSVESTMPDIQACVDFLKPRGSVFMTGYCYGGSVVWLASCRCKGLAAAAGFYGRLTIDYAEERSRTPLILHFGEKDETIPMENVRKIEAAHPEVPVYVYDAGHGFCSDRPTHYDKAACSTARERTLAHFHAHGG